MIRKTLTAVEHHDFDGVKTVSATGDAIFKVYCDEKEYPILLFIIASAVIFPVTELLGDEPVQPVVSPTQP